MYGRRLRGGRRRHWSKIGRGYGHREECMLWVVKPVCKYGR
jgi:hypothetical protein